MHRMAKLRGVTIAALIAVAAAFPVHADIKSFNAAIQAKDFVKAAAEAAATWPDLDKSRSDIAVIAREFGFAAYMAGDFAAARTYGETAVLAGSAENADLQARSNVLLRLASFRTSPTDKARDELFDALTTRAALPGVDLVSYFGLEAVAKYDFDKADWKKAIVSTELGESVTSRDGAGYGLQTLRFGLFNGVSSYLSTRNPESYRKLLALRLRVIDAVNAAPSDESAKDLIALYWTMEAWRNSFEIHLDGRDRLSNADAKEPEFDFAPTSRAVRFLNVHVDEETCRTKVIQRPNINYPLDAYFRGLIGTVVVSFDSDAEGKVSNAKILAAVPRDSFGKTVLANLSKISLKPGESWGPACSLVRQDKVVTFMFMIR